MNSRSHNPNSCSYPFHTRVFARRLSSEAVNTLEMMSRLWYFLCEYLQFSQSMPLHSQQQGSWRTSVTMCLSVHDNIWALLIAEQKSFSPNSTLIIRAFLKLFACPSWCYLHTFDEFDRRPCVALHAVYNRHLSSTALVDVRSVNGQPLHAFVRRSLS